MNATESPAEPAAFADAKSRDRRMRAAQVIAFLVIACVAVWMESARLNSVEGQAELTFGWISDPQVDWTPFLPWLLIAPLCWMLLRPLLSRVPRWWHSLCVWLAHGADDPTSANSSDGGTAWSAVVVSLLLMAVGFGISFRVGAEFGDRPPAYHDEYSYLFQAETFLAGRNWFPGFEPRPELFDQMHVLNLDGRFASRYFPGAGVWMMPFVAAGNPWAGHWLAQAIIVGCVFWIGRDLSGNGVGIVAGLLTALSPGLILFSNLLLAHHPTLVSLSLFLWAFLRMKRRLQCGQWAVGYGVAAGVGLTFAMLCRPMTAAGVGLPFGLWLAGWLVSHRTTRAAWPIGVPLLCGFVLLFFYNRSITGHGLTSPYQLYTDVYTPRHVYGFNNVTRGEQRLGSKVIDNYDRWAENLTPALAVDNMQARLLHSLRWSLGIVPLGMATIVFVITGVGRRTDWWLIFSAIVTLNAVHIPYWFAGIMGYHYVFESLPLWCLLFAASTGWLIEWWRKHDFGLMPLWWCGLTATAVLVNLQTVEPLWPARLDRGIAELMFAREKSARFEGLIQRATADRLSLILVEPDLSDRHIDYVVNHPALNSPVLFARFDPTEDEWPDIAQLFPTRSIYHFNAATGQLVLLRGPDDE